MTASGIAFYTGDKIPRGRTISSCRSMTVGRIGGTGNVQRVAFNENGEQKRETLFQDLHQRFRDVRNGPDGFLYFLTDENDGAILKAEPAKRHPPACSYNSRDVRSGRLNLTSRTKCPLRATTVARADKYLIERRRIHNPHLRNRFRERLLKRIRAP